MLQSKASQNKGAASLLASQVAWENHEGKERHHRAVPYFFDTWTERTRLSFLTQNSSVLRAQA
ncbi:hypothetical protein CBOM_05058 [Ceraceosorus bombacis]|uniref:Uncharacterized protein n=1 Tax=Ceraceosorus bombacis TaxID=401625 RepID=A0A0P1BHN9_9BASI|nr:hypothetical protein CBOM_05058 [Ceraceosorus bombacis]